MKNITKVLLLALALVLTFALVACGENKPPVDDVTTEAPDVTTAGADDPAVTTAPPVVAEPDGFTFEDYYALYVTDGLYFHLNFAEATEDGPAIVGSADYENMEVSAAERFEGAASNFNPYLIGDSAKDVVWGGTAKILAPWYFEDWYKDGFVKQNGGGDGNVANMRTEAPLEYLKIEKREDQDVYVCKSQMLDDGFYYTDGTWTRKTGASSWGNGYFFTGLNSIINFNLSPISTAFKAGVPMSYTFEMTTQRETMSNVTLFIGARYTYNVYQETYFTTGPQPQGFLGNSTNGHLYSMLSNTTDLLKAANSLSFTYDFSDYKNSGNATACVYSNGALNTNQTLPVINSWDGVYINPGEGLKIYSVRVYKKALTEAEVLQNHFADIALGGKLDITEFLKADDAKKLEVYNAFIDFTIDTDAGLLQMVLDAALDY